MRCSIRCVPSYTIQYHPSAAKPRAIARVGVKIVINHLHARRRDAAPWLGARQALVQGVFFGVEIAFWLKIRGPLKVLLSPARRRRRYLALI